MNISHIVYISNQAAILPALAKALRDQAGDHSREIILVDDASVDDSLAIMQKLAREDPTFRLLGSDVPMGAAAALAAGAELAEGMWLHLMPVPGIMPINACHALFDLMQTHHADVVCSQREVSTQSAAELVGKTMVHAPDCTLTDHPLELLLKRKSLPDTLICRRDIFDRSAAGTEHSSFATESLPLQLALIAQRWLTVEAPLLHLPADATAAPDISLEQLKERFAIAREMLATQALLSEEQKRLLYRRAISALRDYRIKGELDGKLSEATIAVLPSLWQYVLSQMPFTTPQPALLDAAARSLNDSESRLSDAA